MLKDATFSNWVAEEPSGRWLFSDPVLERLGLTCPSGNLIMLAASAESWAWRRRSFMAMPNLFRFETSRSTLSSAIMVQRCSHHRRLRFPKHRASSSRVACSHFVYPAQYETFV